jgi:hypothetical protein
MSEFKYFHYQSWPFYFFYLYLDSLPVAFCGDYLLFVVGLL